MPFLILSIDHPDRYHLREELMIDHLQHLERFRDRILAAGALRVEATAKPYGGVTILDVPTKQEADLFSENDPFTKAGLRKSVEISHWTKTFFDRSRVG